MDRRIQIAFFSALLMAAFSCAIVHADTPTPTATWTPRPTRTATPTSATTRTPFPTPTDTPVPLSNKISQSKVAAGPSLGFLSDWGTSIASINKVGESADATISETTKLESSKKPFELDMLDPITMTHGITILLSDIEWLGLLFGWFTLAFLIIILVEIIRLVVSLWGIIKRIIDLIKLLPFL